VIADAAAGHKRFSLKGRCLGTIVLWGESPNAANRACRRYTLAETQTVT
jgi:hypothetical protein